MARFQGEVDSLDSKSDDLKPESRSGNVTSLVVVSPIAKRTKRRLISSGSDMILDRISIVR